MGSPRAGSNPAGCERSFWPKDEDVLGQNKELPSLLLSSAPFQAATRDEVEGHVSVNACGRHLAAESGS